MSKVKFRNGGVMRISDYYLKELIQLHKRIPKKLNIVR